MAKFDENTTIRGGSRSTIQNERMGRFLVTSVVTTGLSEKKQDNVKVEKEGKVLILSLFN